MTTVITSRVCRQDKIRIKQANNEWMAYDPVTLQTKTSPDLLAVWPEQQAEIRIDHNSAAYAANIVNYQ